MISNVSTMLQIRPMTSGDYPDVANIYNQGIETKNATFEKSAPAVWDEFAGKFSDAKFVAMDAGVITGWAALSSVSSRCVYAGVCEVSVYVHAEYRGKRIGKALLQHLIALSEQKNIWTLQAGIFPENKSSVKLHTELGFRIVGFREKIGKMDGIWRDTLLLERRSKVASMN